MSDDRKKPVWPWITALLIGLPVLYLVSFGPACWITSVAGDGRTIEVLYQPLLLQFGWEGFCPSRWDFIDRFSRFAATPGWRIGRDAFTNRWKWEYSYLGHVIDSAP
jgi:hypothetical protein